MFPRYRSWSIFWAEWIHSISYHRISLRFFFISSQLTPRCFKRNTFYIFIEYTITQHHHQQFTMVTSFVLLFRPSSETESFRIKEKPHSRLNVKMGRDLPIYIYIYISPKYVRIFPHYFFLPWLLHVPSVSCSLISLSQSYLKRRTNYEISLYAVFFNALPFLLFQFQLFISPFSKVNIF